MNHPRDMNFTFYKNLQKIVFHRPPSSGVTAWASSPFYFIIFLLSTFLDSETGHQIIKAFFLLETFTGHTVKKGHVVRRTTLCRLSSLF
jgi:hypothetical protein